MKEKELALFAGGVVPVNKKGQVVSLPQAAPPVIAGVKVEGIMTEMTSRSRIELSPAARNVQYQLQIDIKSVSMV